MQPLLRYALVLLSVTACRSKTEDPQPAVSATFTASRTVVEVNEPVSFADVPATAARYAWDFGNGQTATGAAPTVTFAAPGTYTVVLTTYTADNQTSSRAQTIKVGKRYLRAITITALPFQRPDGTDWDAGGSGPDVFVQLRPAAASEAPFTRTPTTSNVTPANLPLNFPASTELTPGEWTIVVRDEDSASDDKMSQWTLPVAGPTANRDAQGNGSYTLPGPPDNPAAWNITLSYETR